MKPTPAPERDLDYETTMMIAAAEDLCEKIEPLLKGKDPGAQGACLVQLTAKWFARHHPDIRGEVIDEHVKAIFDLIPVFEQIILDRFGGQWPVQQ